MDNSVKISRHNMDKSVSISRIESSSSHKTASTSRHSLHNMDKPVKISGGRAENGSSQKQVNTSSSNTANINTSRRVEKSVRTSGQSGSSSGHKPASTGCHLEKSVKISDSGHDSSSHKPASTSCQLKSVRTSGQSGSSSSHKPASTGCQDSSSSHKPVNTTSHQLEKLVKTSGESESKDCCNKTSSLMCQSESREECLMSERGSEEGPGVLSHQSGSSSKEEPGSISHQSNSCNNNDKPASIIHQSESTNDKTSTINHHSESTDDKTSTINHQSDNSRPKEEPGSISRQSGSSIRPKEGPGSISQQSDSTIKPKPDSISQQSDSTIKPKPDSISHQSDSTIKPKPDSISQQSDSTIKPKPDSISHQSDSTIKPKPDSISQQSDSTIKPKPDSISHQSDSTIKLKPDSISQQSDSTIKLKPDSISQQSDSCDNNDKPSGISCQSESNRPNNKPASVTRQSKSIDNKPANINHKSDNGRPNEKSDNKPANINHKSDNGRPNEKSDNKPATINHKSDNGRPNEKSVMISRQSDNIDCCRPSEKRARRRKTSFTEALKEKYCVEDDLTFDFIIVSPKRKTNSSAELAHLQTVVLNDMGITRADIPRQGLVSLCPNVVDLDLANNLLETWSELLSILSHLPKVRYLNVSRNKINLDLANASESLLNRKLSVENLALNDTGTSIEEVVRLSQLMPMLKELHLCDNNYEDLASIEDCVRDGALSCLECLRLNNNEITRWSEVWKLRDLPHLKCLVLSGNPISNVFYRNADRTNNNNTNAPFLYSRAGHSTAADVSQMTSVTTRSDADINAAREKCLQCELADSNMDVNCVCDGILIDNFDQGDDGVTDEAFDDVDNIRPVSRLGFHSQSGAGASVGSCDSQTDAFRSDCDHFRLSKRDDRIGTVNNVHTGVGSSNLNNSCQGTVQQCLCEGYDVFDAGFLLNDEVFENGNLDAGDNMETDDWHRAVAEEFLHDIIDGITFDDFCDERVPQFQPTSCDQTLTASDSLEDVGSNPDSISDVNIICSIENSSTKQLSTERTSFEASIFESVFAASAQELAFNLDYSAMGCDLDAQFIPRAVRLFDDDIKNSFFYMATPSPPRSRVQRCLFQDPAGNGNSQSDETEDTSYRDGSHQSTSDSCSDCEAEQFKHDKQMTNIGADVGSSSPCAEVRCAAPETSSANLKPQSSTVYHNSLPQISAPEGPVSFLATGCISQPVIECIQNISSTEPIGVSLQNNSLNQPIGVSLQNNSLNQPIGVSLQDNSLNQPIGVSLQDKPIRESTQFLASAPTCRSCHDGQNLESNNNNISEHSPHNHHCDRTCPHIRSEPRPAPFQHLQVLCLSSANLNHWNHLTAFTAFPKLTNLRLKNNPLYSSVGPEDRRKLYIASLPKVSVLNGSEVTHMEREKAERHYLRYFMDKEDKPDSYHALVKKHGPPVKLVDIDLSAGYQEWANLKFVCKGVEEFSRKIHLVDPVCKLRILISQVMKLPRSCFVMYHFSCGPSHPESERELVELRCESLPMSRFDFADGDEIHIDFQD